MCKAAPLGSSSAYIETRASGRSAVAAAPSTSIRAWARACTSGGKYCPRHAVADHPGGPRGLFGQRVEPVVGRDPVDRRRCRRERGLQAGEPCELIGPAIGAEAVAVADRVDRVQVGARAPRGDEGLVRRAGGGPVQSGARTTTASSGPNRRAPMWSA